MSAQFDQYFSGARSGFALPIDPDGTPFQKAVWKAIQKIPAGRTRSYADIAREIGRPNAYRAVGNALNRNPLCIVTPCHRVTTSDGGLGGYAFGRKAKKHLLSLEGVSVRG